MFSFHFILCENRTTKRGVMTGIVNHRIKEPPPTTTATFFWIGSCKRDSTRKQGHRAFTNRK